MTDTWALMPNVEWGPAENAAAVTPNDSTDLTTITTALIVQVSGTIAVDMLGGQSVTIGALAGQYIPIRVRRVRATGTTATGIVAFW